MSVPTGGAWPSVLVPPAPEVGALGRPPLPSGGWADRGGTRQPGGHQEAPLHQPGPPPARPLPRAAPFNGTAAGALPWPSAAEEPDQHVGDPRLQRPAPRLGGRQAREAAAGGGGHRLPGDRGAGRAVGGRGQRQGGGPAGHGRRHHQPLPGAGPPPTQQAPSFPRAWGPVLTVPDLDTPLGCLPSLDGLPSATGPFYTHTLPSPSLPTLPSLPSPTPPGCGPGRSYKCLC